MAPKRLYLHTSNRIERLAQRLAQVNLEEPLSSPLGQETVMTLNPGMARWLQFEIAKLTGVSFGWDFPLPGRVFERILSGFAPDFAIKGAIPENAARWILHDELGKLDASEGFKLLRGYCSGGGPTRRLRLASRLARMFDEYLVYRAATIMDWEASTGSGDWQAELWRRLIRTLFPNQPRPLHIARLWHRLRSTLPGLSSAQVERWPERLCLFGISSLAPLYLDLLDAVSYHRPVHIFLLQPSDLYWADLKSTRQIARIAQRSQQDLDPDAEAIEFDPAQWLFDSGNPLLPALGRQGQSFLDLVLDRDPIQDDSAFAPPHPALSQLSALQSDLFTLTDRGEPDSSADPETSFPSYDGSIQIHICSSKRREIEALWDYLMERFNSADAPRPNEVLVMAPDIQIYASHIDSVFSRPPDDPLAIPYSIADQLDQQRSAAIAGVCSLLEFAKGRATAMELRQELESPLVREAFNLSDLDLQHIEFWIRELGITWGWHAEHRRQQGGFPTDRNTWRELKDRLAAGVAFGEAEPDRPLPFPPYGGIEADLVDTAGRLIEFLDLLEEVHQWQSARRSVAEWQNALLGLVARFNRGPESWLGDFQKVIASIREALPAMDTVRATGAEAIEATLDALQRSAPSAGYLGGGITFCSLKPMRSIPADTICLIGMNHREFPRHQQRLSFDLLERQRQRGDRNAREEDRQFFLETLLAVRRSLYISYLGLSPTSEEQKEPSSVVTELLNYLKRCLSEEDLADLRTAHKRQSYDPEYFIGNKLFTYDPERARLRNRFDHRANSEEPPPPAAPEDDADSAGDLGIETLIAFCRDPARAYAETALQLRFGRAAEQLEELDEVFQEGLGRFQLRQAIAASFLSSNGPRGDLGSLSARKLLPPGGLAQIAFAEASEYAAPLAEYHRAWVEKDPPRRLRLALPFRRYTLRGVLIARESTEQLILSPGELNVAREIDFWIRHLCANCLALRRKLPPQPTLTLSLHPKQLPVLFVPREDAESQLERLISLWERGCQEPLPLLPTLSRKLVSDIALARRPLSEQEALEKAAMALEMAQDGSETTCGWSEYDSLCFGSDFGLPNDFLQQSLDFWLPLIESRREPPLDELLHTH